MDNNRLIPRPTLKLNFPAKISTNVPNVTNLQAASKNKNTESATKPPGNDKIWKRSTKPDITKENITAEAHSETLGKTNHNNDAGKVKKTAPSKMLLTPEKYKSILMLLRTTYPKCFTDPPAPLMINIHKELWALHAEELSKTAIKKFLTIYCLSKAYRQACILGATRVDLQGNTSSPVTEEQVQKNKRRDIARKTNDRLIKPQSSVNRAETVIIKRDSDAEQT